MKGKFKKPIALLLALALVFNMGFTAYAGAVPSNYNDNRLVAKAGDSGGSGDKTVPDEVYGSPVASEVGLLAAPATPDYTANKVYIFGVDFIIGNSTNDQSVIPAFWIDSSGNLLMAFSIHDSKDPVTVKFNGVTSTDVTVYTTEQQTLRIDDGSSVHSFIANDCDGGSNADHKWMVANFGVQDPDGTFEVIADLGAGGHNIGDQGKVIIILLYDLTVIHNYGGTVIITKDAVDTPYGSDVSESRIDEAGYTLVGISSTIGALTDETIDLTTGTINGKMPKEAVTIEFTYTCNTPALTVKHIYDGTEVVTKNAVATAYDSDVSESKIDETGFTFTGVESTVGALTGEAVVGSTISGKMPNEAVTIVFTYTRNNYGLTVIHSYEGEMPVTTVSEDRAYDSAVEEYISYRNGYYLTSIETTVGDLTNETIYGYYISGKMPAAAVTIVFTYVKNQYEVHYLGGGSDVTGSLVDALSPYKYNTTVTVLNNREDGFKKTGYHVIGWDRLWENEQNYVSKVESIIEVPDYYPGNTFTMPANDVYLSAIWAPNTDTQYTIETYLQENGEYPLTATSSVVKHDGTTGEPKTITVPDIEGYRFDKADPAELTQAIAADGSAVFKLYYRKLYTITYQAGENGILTGGNQIHKLYYGALYPKAPEPVANTNYVFSGWTPALPGVEDTVTEDKTFTAYFTPKATTSYTVYYYRNGTTTSLHEPKTVTGQVIGSTVTESAVTVSRYSVVAPATKTITLAESANIIIFYYARKSTPDPKPRPTPNRVVIIEEPIPLALNTVDHFQYLQGYPDNTVRPEGNITREEVAAVFYRLLMDDYRGTIMTNDENFPDVEANTWSTKCIATLTNGKILEGYKDGTFKPHDFITKAELAAVASRFDNLSPFEDDSFTDIAGHWANKYINSAAKKGWVNGNPDRTFKPDKYITRAEFATLVNNVLDRRVHKDKILEAARKFPDLPSTKWYYEAMMEAVNSHLFNRLEDGYEEWTEITHPDIEL